MNQKGWAVKSNSALISFNLFATIFILTVSPASLGQPARVCRSIHSSPSSTAFEFKVGSLFSRHSRPRNIINWPKIRNETTIDYDAWAEKLAREDIIPEIPRITEKINKVIASHFSHGAKIQIEFGLLGEDFYSFNNYIGHKIQISPLQVLFEHHYNFRGINETYDIFLLGDRKLNQKMALAVYAHEYGHLIFEENILSRMKNTKNIRGPYDELFADIISYIATDGFGIDGVLKTTSEIGQKAWKAQPKDPMKWQSSVEFEWSETRSFETTATFSNSDISLSMAEGHDVFVHFRSWLGHHRAEHLKDPVKAGILLSHLVKAIRVEMKRQQKTPLKDAEQMNLSLHKTFLKIEGEAAD